MKIATTTQDFSRFCESYEEQIKEIANAGFKYIDLSLYNVNHMQRFMGDNYKEEAQKLVDLANRLNVQFVQAHGPNGNPLSTNENDVKDYLSRTIRAVEVCSFLGIKNVVSHNGVMPNITKEEWFERNNVVLKNIFPVLEKTGINLLCENSTKINMGKNYFINSGKDMLDFIKYVDHPLYHGCWDTGHANCEGNQYNDILMLDNHLYAIHYNDNRGFSDEHLLPYFGTLNHDEIINALIDVNYKGYFTLESCLTLRPYKFWLGDRKEFSKKLLSEPQIFMQRHVEKLLFDTAKWMLDSYDIYEE